MTREYALQILDTIPTIGEQVDAKVCYIANGIPLEQIRDEIEQLYTVDTVYEDVVAVDKADVLRIIDKYRGDKE